MHINCYLRSLQFFEGFGYHGTSFEQTYRCFPASFIEKVWNSSFYCCRISIIMWHLINQNVQSFFCFEFSLIFCTFFSSLLIRVLLPNVVIVSLYWVEWGRRAKNLSLKQSIDDGYSLMMHGLWTFKKYIVHY